MPRTMPFYNLKKLYEALTQSHRLNKDGYFIGSINEAATIAGLHPASGEPAMRHLENLGCVELSSYDVSKPTSTMSRMTTLIKVVGPAPTQQAYDRYVQVRRK